MISFYEVGVKTLFYLGRQFIMAKSENQKLKLYYLGKILLEKTDSNHGLTMEQLIEELSKYNIKSERKCLYSDIKLLKDMGITVTGKKSRNDYQYFVTGRDFELAELKLLVDAIQSSRFITEKKSRSLISKLETLCSKYDAMSLQRQVFVQDRIKTMNESIYKSIDGIHAGISSNRKISFHYGYWSPEKKLELKRAGELYRISPWALVWSNENYYMIGFDSETSKIKHYRVDKMLDISVMDEGRDGNEHFEHFNPASYTRKNISMYEGSDRTVTIDIEDSIIGVFIDRFGRNEITVIPKENGHSLIRFEVSLNPQFLGWIFSLGNKAKIIGPESAVSTVKSMIDELSNRYN